MEEIRIAILNKNNLPVGFLDNSAPAALHYRQDLLTVYLNGTAHTFDFVSDAEHPEAKFLKVGNKLAFRRKSRDYYMTIVQTDQDEYDLHVTALSMDFELLNEIVPEYYGAHKKERTIKRRIGTAYDSTNKGVKSITEYYAITATKTAPADDKFSTTKVSPTEAKPYLWNYKKITYGGKITVGGKSVSSETTAKRNISTWSATGRGESTVNEQYATSTNSSTAPSDSWSDTVPTMDATKKYLWNYETIEYYVNPPKTFEELLKVFDPTGVLTLVRNDISNRTRTVTFEERSTLLDRLYALGDVFSAEIELLPVLDSDYGLQAINLSVYRKHSATVQGIGKRRMNFTLRYGVQIDGITKTQDVTGLYTAIKPIGKDGITLAGYAPEGSSGDRWQYYNEDKKLMYVKKTTGTIIYAYNAMKQFPAHAARDKSEVISQYIVYYWDTDYQTQKKLFSNALNKLMEISVPKISYTVSGFYDVDIGDTIMIADEDFEPELYLEARVTQQQISFTDPDRNQTVFDNFIEHQSQISDQLTALAKSLRLYTAALNSSNGTVFRNKKGKTVLTATVTLGGKKIKIKAVT